MIYLKFPKVLVKERKVLSFGMPYLCVVYEYVGPALPSGRVSRLPEAAGFQVYDASLATMHQSVRMASFGALSQAATGIGLALWQCTCVQWLFKWHLFESRFFLKKKTSQVGFSTPPHSLVFYNFENNLFCKRALFPRISWGAYVVHFFP